MPRLRRRTGVPDGDQPADPAPMIAAVRKLVWILRHEANKEGEVEVHTDMLADALRDHDAKRVGK